MNHNYLQTQHLKAPILRWAMPGLMALLFLLTAITPAHAKGNSKVLAITPVKKVVLSSLNIFGATLTKAFLRNLFSYTANAPAGTTSVSVAAATLNAKSKITVNGAALVGGVATVPLTAGTTVIAVKVTLPDNITSQTYIVNVMVPVTNITSLTLLKLGGAVPLVPGAVTATETDYTATVAAQVVAIYAATTDPLAVMTLNGAPLSNNVFSAALPLAFGPNVITLHVLAQDGVTYMDYVLNILRPSNKAGLTSLAFNNTSLFFPTTTGGGLSTMVNFDTGVDPSTSSVTLTPTGIDNVETILVNGVQVASGATSGPIDVPDNPTIINMTTTSQDGLHTKAITVTVYKNGDNNSQLSSLTADAGSTPTVTKISATEYDYATAVTGGVATVNITPVVAAPGAVITVGGSVVASNAPIALPLAIGDNVLTLLVTAADGVTTTTYKYTVTRAAPINPLRLSSLVVMGNGSLSPAFNPNILNYTWNTDNYPDFLDFSLTGFDPKVNIYVFGEDPYNFPQFTGGGSGSIFYFSAKIYIRLTNPANGAISFYTIYVPSYYDSQDFSLGNGIKSTYVVGSTTADNSSIVVHPALSPNGDSHNDRLMIDGLSKYPENKLTVINRQGAVIFEAKNYDSNLNPFTGHVTKTGKLAEPGTYFYSLQYKTGGKLKTKTGYIVIKY